MLKIVKTFVLYIGVRNVREVDIADYLKKIKEKLLPINLPEDSQLIFLPTDSTENKLVCIDPEYITNDELIARHNVLLYELNTNIKKIIIE